MLENRVLLAVTPGLTLTATANPDFGQVEADRLGSGVLPVHQHDTVGRDQDV